MSFITTSPVGYEILKSEKIFFILIFPAARTRHLASNEKVFMG